MICTLCPRMCRAQRDETHGEGYCGMGTRAVVARAAPHYWEEACLSGTRGCGTIFFSGCPLGCVYCQNYEISHEKQGRPVTDEELAELIANLAAQGVHNISFVTGTHFVPAILRALDIARPALPIVWNTGGYERVDTLRGVLGNPIHYLQAIPRAAGNDQMANNRAARHHALHVILHGAGLPQHFQYGL